MPEPREEHAPLACWTSGGISEEKWHLQTDSIVLSEFNKMASRIGLDIHETLQNVSRLAKLAKKTSMFDDLTMEIQVLTTIIKQDITSLNAVVSDLQTLQNPQIGDGNCSKDSTIHSTTIVDDLKSRLI